MNDTKAGNSEPLASSASESESEPLHAPPYLGWLCAASTGLFTSDEDIRVVVHQSLPQFRVCAKECKFCRYVYACFGEELMEQIITLHPVENGGGLRVEATLDKANSAVEVVLVKIQNGTRYLGRNFNFLKNGARGMERSIWNCPRPMDFSARVSTLTGWLSECLREHPDCHNNVTSTAARPARLLEVLSNSGECMLRLAPSDVLHDAAYVTLSHCWGGVEILSKTTMDNVDDYYLSIDPATLPKTFREAIEITRALGVRYLWIDSLCIIQDQISDWEEESSKMAAIYCNAVLTISASGAKDSTGGCGISYTLWPAVQFRVSHQNEPRTTYICMRDIHRAYLWSRPSKDSPVNERAWIFQEAMLSKRILHARNGPFTWECVTHRESEDCMEQGGSRESFSMWTAIRGLSESRRAAGIGAPAKLARTWWFWMLDFTLRHLTKPGDNYAALAGVTEIFRQVTGDEPVLALWRSDLISHLAWEGHLRRELRGLVPLPKSYEPEKRRPSWTWMSYPHGSVSPSLNWEVIFDDSELDPTDVWSTRQYKAEVLKVDIDWGGRPLVNAPRSATLKLRGLRHRKKAQERFGGPGQYGQFWWDPGFDPEDGEVYNFFALFSNEKKILDDSNCTKLHTVYLVLEVVEAEGVFRRIGIHVTTDFVKAPTNAKDYLVGSYEDITIV